MRCPLAAKKHLYLGLIALIITVILNMMPLALGLEESRTYAVASNLITSNAQAPSLLYANYESSLFSDSSECNSETYSSYEPIEAYETSDEDMTMTAETLIGICANGTEFWGFTSIFGFFVGCLVAFACQRYILGAVLLLSCPMAVTVGLAAYPFCTFLMEAADHAQIGETGLLMLGLIPIMISLCLLYGYGFYPAFRALKSEHPKQFTIFALTFFSWMIPIGWPMLLYWALRNEEPVNEDAIRV